MTSANDGFDFGYMTINLSITSRLKLHSSDSNTHRSGDAGVLINTETLKKSLIIALLPKMKDLGRNT